jgi:hypothetical protein
VLTSLVAQFFETGDIGEHKMAERSPKEIEAPVVALLY